MTTRRFFSGRRQLLWLPDIIRLRNTMRKTHVHNVVYEGVFRRMNYSSLEAEGFISFKGERLWGKEVDGYFLPNDSSLKRWKRRIEKKDNKGVLR